MPIPTHLQTALSYTPLGVPYQTLLDGLAWQAADDANQVDVRVIVGREDYNQFEAEAVGYAEWDYVSTTLQRTLPLECPLRPGLYCETVTVVKWGPGLKEGDEKGEPYNDEFLDNWPGNVPWVVAKLTFTRPKWNVVADDKLAADHGSKEQFRFTKISRKYSTREQRQPGQSFEIDQNPEGAASYQATDSPAFVPVYETEVYLHLIGWPVDAFPEHLVGLYSGTVNLTDFPTGDGYTYAPGSLLFRGLAQEVTWYQNAAGDFAVSPVLNFAYKPGGWNKQLLNKRTAGSPPERRYGNVRFRGVTPDTPPHASTEFQDLLTPSIQL